MKKLSMLAMAMSTVLLSGCILKVNAHDHQHSASGLTETQHQLVLDNANQLSYFDISAGRGNLEIVGDDSVTSITVDAIIGSEDGKDYEFTLKKSGDGAKLLAKSDGGMFSNSHAYLHLTVRVPSSLKLNVSDGSGDMSINNFANDVEISDGSGLIRVDNVIGKLDISDGSGNIALVNAGSDVSISDGSGNITLAKVSGNVRISDGSGNIIAEHVSGNVQVSDGSGHTRVEDVTGDVRIEDGSGDINVNRVSGVVTITDGSGNINVDDAGSLIIEAAGSGGVNTNNIHGKMSL